MKIKLLSNEYLFTVVTKFFIILISLLNTVIINRYLGRTLKGEYAYIINIVTILSLTMNLGIGFCYSYFKRNNIKNIKTKFISIIFTQFLVYIIAYLILFQFIENAELKVGILIAIFVTLDMQIFSLSMIENINVRNKINLLSTLAYTFVLVILFLFSYKNFYYMLYAYVTKYILNTSMLIIHFKLYKNFNIRTLSIKLIIDIFKVSIISMTMTLLITFNYNIDIIILKRFVDSGQIGIYSVAVTLASILWFIPDAFKDVLFNKTSRKDSINEIVISIKINIYICVLVIVGFTCFGKLFIYVLYGNEFVSAYKVTWILFLGVIPMIFYKLIHPLYIAKGKQNTITLILFLSVVFNVLLNYLTIPIWGIVGAALSSVVSYSVCGVFFLFIFVMEYNIKFLSIFLIDKNDLEIFKTIIHKKEKLEQ